MSRMFLPATHTSCFREAVTAGAAERMRGAVAPLPNMPEPARDATCGIWAKCMNQRCKDAVMCMLWAVLVLDRDSARLGRRCARRGRTHRDSVHRCSMLCE